ncbi:MAG TPA: NAD(P)-binding domain-containing protein, partial [Deinococcales bacterium]|nr:NAD(P)-binding domain-containing protein [Deinococcales bacterium]
MRIAMIGLGRMGGNMTRRLVRAGHEVVGYDRDPETVAGLAAEGAIPAASIPEAVEKSRQDGRAVAWVMVPAGAPTAQAISAVSTAMQAGDVIIDGGNSNFHDTRERATVLREQGIDLLDAGTSGGVWGLENGYCLMIGGPLGAFRKAEPVFRALAPEN